MNDSQPKQDNLLDTTDCLEAIGVFRTWKNLLFVVIICCLLLLQALFWVVDLGIVNADKDANEAAAGALPADGGTEAEPAENVEIIGIKVVDDTNEIEQAALKVAADVNVSPAKESGKRRFPPDIRFKHLAWLIRLLNFVLVPAAMLYCLTILFSLKVSLLGRLGGINHISRAFFISLLMFVLILPWQKFFLFADVLAGAIYTPGELLRRYAAAKTSGVLGQISYYWRFSGYWLIVMLLQVFSLVRSSRWTRATLRRLEII
ncbi:MAG: hypothetical protein ACYTEL_05520 [Planctomycetota bacterium]|jgi:hypothetical protein